MDGLRSVWRGAMTPGSPLRRLGRWLTLGVASFAFFAVLLAGAATVLGLDTFVVSGGSMAPAVRQGSLLVAERVDPAAIRPGDVVTFQRGPDAATVTHRVVDIRETEDGELVFSTKGDANPNVDPEEVSSDLPLSRMLFAVPYAGYVLAFASTTVGKVLLILVPGLGLLIATALASRGTVAPVPPAPAVPQASQAAQWPPPAAPPSPPAGIGNPRASSPWPDLRGWLRRLRPPSRDGETGTAMRAAGPKTSGEPARPRRVERIAHAFERHADGSRALVEEIDREAGPVSRLLAEQAETATRLRSNVVEKLAPMLEYAESLEASIAALQRQMSSTGGAPPPQSLRLYVAEQRRRGAETRTSIEDVLRPFDDYLRAERETVEAVLAPLDEEVRALQVAFAEERRVLKRILERMRSEPFEQALEYLQERQGRMRELAEVGASDPKDLHASLATVPVPPSHDVRDPAYLEAVRAAVEAAGALLTPDGRDEDGAPPSIQRVA